MRGYHRHRSLTDSLGSFREIDSIKKYLASERRVPITEKELGKGSTQYDFVSVALMPYALTALMRPWSQGVLLVIAGVLLARTRSRCPGAARQRCEACVSNVPLSKTSDVGLVAGRTQQGGHGGLEDRVVNSLHSM